MSLEDDATLECLGEPERPVTEDFCEKIGVPYADVFTGAEAMAKAARAMRAESGDAFSKLPFCVTAEAEALGAHAEMDPLSGVPTVQQFLYKDLSEVDAIPPFDFTRGRIAEVLQGVRLLTASGERVILHIEGPYTILSLLMPSKVLYKGLFRQKEKLLSLCRQLSVQIARYAQAAEEAGACILSYADPTVSYDIVSPKTYREMCGPVSCEVVRAILDATQHVMVHLCNKTSVGFENAGFCTSERVPVDAGLSYGEALASVFGRDDCRLIGHGCLQRSNAPCERGYLYQLRLAGSEDLPTMPE